MKLFSIIGSYLTLGLGAISQVNPGVVGGHTTIFGFLGILAGFFLHMAPSPSQPPVK